MTIGLLAGALAVIGLMVGCSTDKNEKISSIYELKARPDADNIERIRTMLTDADRDIRATALNALVTLGVPDAATLCRDALGDEDGFVRATAAKLSGELDDGVDPGLLVDRLLQDPDVVVRQRAAEALTEIGGTAAVDGLGRALLDPMEEVRLAAVRGLRELDPQPAKPLLARLLLEDPMYEVRVQAARALGSTGDPEVRPVLEAALQDPNEFVRAAAANALRVHKAVGEREAAAAGRRNPS